jgi:hypothetical protein
LRLFYVCVGNGLARAGPTPKESYRLSRLRNLRETKGFTHALCSKVEVTQEREGEREREGRFGK